ncbi:MAG: hypothetical protein KDA31_07330 [Phycisphaerales bacterium]|nr:hypothetical protein [Phycisphaerales bacterium]
MLTVSTRTLHRLVGTRDFPKPIRIGRAVRWRRRTVAAYLDRDQKRAERKPRSGVN